MLKVRKGHTFQAVAAHIGGISAATSYRDTVEGKVLGLKDRRAKLLGLYSSGGVAPSLEGEGAADFGVRVKISSGKAAN